MFKRVINIYSILYSKCKGNTTYCGLYIIKRLFLLTMLLIVISNVNKVNASITHNVNIYADEYTTNISQTYEVDDYDLKLLAEVMYHENYMNGYECMYLTGAVVINRVNHDRFPDTIHDVLYQKGQYATTGRFFTKTIPTEVYDIAERLLMYQACDVPSNVIFQAMRKQGSGIYKIIPSSYAPEKDKEYFCYE